MISIHNTKITENTGITKHSKYEALKQLPVRRHTSDPGVIYLGLAN